MTNPTANLLHGKIKRITHNPPYVLATIELDPNVPQEITVSYVPVAGAAKDAQPGAATAQAAQASPPSPPAQGDGVNVLVPVPNAVIIKGY